jgi:hypothetical protein
MGKTHGFFPWEKPSGKNPPTLLHSFHYLLHIMLWVVIRDARINMLRTCRHSHSIDPDLCIIIRTPQWAPIPYLVLCTRNYKLIRTKSLKIVNFFRRRTLETWTGNSKRPKVPPTGSCGCAEFWITWYPLHFCIPIPIPIPTPTPTSFQLKSEKCIYLPEESRYL